MASPPHGPTCSLFWGLLLLTAFSLLSLHALASASGGAPTGQQGAPLGAPLLSAASQPSPSWGPPTGIGGPPAPLQTYQGPERQQAVQSQGPQAPLGPPGLRGPPHEGTGAPAAPEVQVGAPAAGGGGPVRGPLRDEGGPPLIASSAMGVHPPSPLSDAYLGGAPVLGGPPGPSATLAPADGLEATPSEQPRGPLTAQVPLGAEGAPPSPRGPPGPNAADGGAVEAHPADKQQQEMKETPLQQQQQQPQPQEAMPQPQEVQQLPQQQQQQQPQQQTQQLPQQLPQQQQPQQQ
ncbi:hypothetical protein EAH_00063060, partial [Eimeria acervulina]